MLRFIPAALLLTIGLGLLLLANSTPWHSDEAFYNDLAAIETRFYNGETGTDTLNREFHALQDRYRTNKWTYADAGYLCVALSFFVTLLAALRIKFWRSNHARLGVGGVFLVFYALLWVGVIASAVQLVGRRLIPSWADSLGIPISGAIGGGTLLLAPMALFLLWPLILRRTAPVALIYWDSSRPWRSAVATFFYAIPTLAFSGLAVLVAVSEGSWAATPALLGLAWLALNARALIIAPKRDA